MLCLRVQVRPIVPIWYTIAVCYFAPGYRRTEKIRISVYIFLPFYVISKFIELLVIFFIYMVCNNKNAGKHAGVFVKKISNILFSRCNNNVAVFNRTMITLD